MLQDHITDIARQTNARREAEVHRQLRSIAGGTIVAFSRSDWVLLYDDDIAGRFERSADGNSIRYTAPLPRICPVSLYESRLDGGAGAARFAEFLRTGKIPDDCPELRRICAIRNVGK